MENSNIINQNVEEQKFNKDSHQTITSEDLLVHQEPIAMAMKTMFSILNYEKRILPNVIFNSLVESLKQNLIRSLDNIKVQTESQIVDIDGNSINKENI